MTNFCISICFVYYSISDCSSTRWEIFICLSVCLFLLFFTSLHLLTPSAYSILHSPSLPALDWQLPSCSGPYSLQIEMQPKSHHRAHYETEGSRGAVKAPSGGHPVVQVKHLSLSRKPSCSAVHGWMPAESRNVITQKIHWFLTGLALFCLKILWSFINLGLWFFIHQWNAQTDIFCFHKIHCFFFLLELLIC